MLLKREPRFLWASKQFREIRQKGRAVKIDILAQYLGVDIDRITELPALARMDAGGRAASGTKAD